MENKADTIATVGAVGDDSAKRASEKAMQDAGITPLYKVVPKKGTGFRVTSTDYDYDTGTVQYCRYTVPRAGEEYYGADLDAKETEAAMSKMSWLYLDGGSVYADEWSAHALAKRAAADGQRILLNLSFTDIINVRHHTMELVDLADVVVMNKDAAECISAFYSIDEERDWEKGVRKLAKRVPMDVGNLPMLMQNNGDNVVKWFVVTRGKEDIAVVKACPLKKAPDDVQITYVKTPAAPKADWMKYMPSDRRGVGDIFAGGLVAALAQGKEMQEAVEVGHKLAAYSLNYKGPKLPPKDGEEEEPY